VESLARSRGRPKPPRIFLGPCEIAGYYASLETGLRELGIVVRAIDLEGNPFLYGAGSRHYPGIVRLARRVGARYRQTANPFCHAVWMVAHALVNTMVLAWAIAHYDVFVFGFGKTFLGTRELPLLRRLGKRVIFVFHGSDARPPYIDGVRMAPDRAMPILDCIALTRKMKASIGRIERGSDVVVAQPAFSHFFERPVVNFFAIGVPWRDPPSLTEDGRHSDHCIRILHSPSDPTVKGSARIREVVDQLKSEGLPLELVELREVPNDVVLREITACDFAIDQIYSDAPMVGFATEAAVAGKPTIVGSYAWPENHRVFGQVPMPPVEECAPEGLFAAVRGLSAEAEKRRSLGLAAQAYVHEYWSRAQIAGRFMTLIEGRAAAEWMFDPRELRYVEGCGLTRDQARANVRAVIEVGGPAALCLSDKPELEALFVDFVNAD
jgi:hypothetical protein